MDRKKLPVGQDDFRKLIENGYYFVDKSLFIKELLDKRDLVNLITRPRRFGKTLNMSMLQYFFENSDKNYEVLFQDLKIYKEKELCETNMGKYPVISLTFMNTKHKAFEDAISLLKNAISSEFKRHMDAVNAYPFNRERIDAIINVNNDAIASYKDSIYFLTEILHYYYKQDVIILIDEYDVPLESAFNSNYYESMLDFVRALLGSALKSNSFLHFAVLTGCLRISKESVFTGLNNFSVFSLMNRSFSGSFGFRPDEVRQLLTYYHLDDKMDEIREWYDGYAIGNREIYNPWSVTKQVKAYIIENADPVSHWGNTSGNDIVKQLIEKAPPNTKNEIEYLLAGNVIEKPIAEDMTYQELYHNINNVWSFLFYTGYLTAEKITVKNGVHCADLRIPNKEIEYIFINKIREWFTEAAVVEDKGNKIYQLMLMRDTDALEKLLKGILFDSISYMDYSENYYHGIMVGLLAQTGAILKSNRETGLGRADITLQDSQTAVIIELKVAESSDKLKFACQEALIQIKEKEYAHEFNNLDCIKIGIAFYQKSCAVLIK